MSNPDNEWFFIDDITGIDSPALVIYRDRIIENIQRLTGMVKGPGQLRPHVKTNKMAEVCALMMDAGITKFKCATIAEAEMLAQLNAPDVLLAYQPVGPKIQRLINLIKKYPGTAFSCLIDNAENAANVSALFEENSLTATVFIDLNTGMNRSGIRPENALPLIKTIQSLPAITLAGLHAYDGHIRDTDVTVRQQKSDAGFDKIWLLEQQIKNQFQVYLTIVIGGSPTFPTHAARQNVECSPGTFIFWDWGYKHQLPDEPFDYAALVITRIISVIDEHTVCTDLGHKSVAAENPLPRVHFLNAPEAEPIGQSEEHLVLKVPDSKAYSVGDVLYGVPVHICPTVALYDTAYVIEHHQLIDEWKVIARNRRITV